MNDETRSEVEQAQDKPEQEKEKQSHYYAFSFYGRTLDDLSVWASAYLCLTEKRIAKKDILHAKEAAGVRNTATLIAVSYLGAMTKEEFTHE